MENTQRTASKWKPDLADGERPTGVPPFRRADEDDNPDHSPALSPNETAPHLAMRGRWGAFARCYLGWLMGYKTAT